MKLMGDAAEGREGKEVSYAGGAQGTRVPVARVFMSVVIFGIFAGIYTVASLLLRLGRAGCAKSEIKSSLK